MLVLPGADLQAAARHAADEALRNAGQVCVSVERASSSTPTSPP